MKIRIRFRGVEYGFGKINHLHENVVKLREIMLPHFENKYFGNDIDVIEYFFVENHYELPTMIWYPTTGVYKCRYIKKPKEIRTDLCFDNLEELADDISAFNVVKELFLNATEQICNKCRSKKLDFNVQLYSEIINNALAARSSL